MYSEHCETFAGLPVRDFEGARSWQGCDVAYRLRDEYEDEKPLVEKLEEFLTQPETRQLTALVIGIWTGGFEGDDSSDIVAKLAASAPKLPALRALFLGDIVYEEYELSWIKQSDVAPLLIAFPELQVFRIRGGDGLKFGRVEHAALRELAIETGGLNRSIIREIFLCDFPNLEHLELHLGDQGYGFDGNVDDLQPVLAGKLYPKLRTLGLRNSEIADELAAVIVNSPIVERIDVLDLSLGNLTEAGARSLMRLPAEATLQRLDISHHYVPAPVIEELQRSVKCQVVAEDPQDPNEEFRMIAHAE